MKKRLPVLLVAVAGAFLWRGGFGLLPVERELTWRLWGDFGSIRRVELQLYEREELLQRTQLEFPGGAGFEPTTRLSLRKGVYRGMTLLYRAGGSAPEVREREIVVDEGTAAVSVE